jgi:hypothetical protein
MSCRTGYVGNAFFTLWGDVEAADVNRVLWEVAKAHMSVGKKMVFLGIAPPNVKPPGPEVRAAFSKTLKSLNEHLCMNIMVVEGDGIKKSLVRTMVSAIILISGDRGTNCIVDSVTEGLTRAKAHLVDPPAYIIEKAREQGLVIGGT